MNVDEVLGLELYIKPHWIHQHGDLKEAFVHIAWVKVFRINPEFRILRLTFCVESQPQNAELGRL